MPTPTPPYSELVILSSGQAMLIERTWSMGELFIGLAVLALAMLVCLRFAYDLSRRETKQNDY